MEEKPQLLLSRSGNGKPIDYACSRCSRIFLIPDGLSPKDAAAALYWRFKEHVELHHAPEPTDAKRRAET